MNPHISRRTFCVRAAQASVGFALTGIPLPGSASAGHEVTIDLTLSANSALTSIGGALYVIMPSTGTKAIVVRNSETEVSAFSSVCTHNGCQVGLPVSGIATCPCHGARFSDTGVVLKGPAASDLKKYYASIDGTVVYVDSDPVSVIKEQSMPENGNSALAVSRYRGNETLNLSWTDGTVQPGTVSLIDVKGRHVSSMKWDGRNTCTIATGKMPRGEYILKVSVAGGEVLVRRVSIN